MKTWLGERLTWKMPPKLPSPMLRCSFAQNPVGDENIRRTRMAVIRIPSPGLGLSLDPNEHQMAIKWWLGLNTSPGSPPCALCPEHPLDPLGHHAVTSSTWLCGKPAAFDLTVVSPLNPTFISEAGRTAGSAAVAAELRKHSANDAKCSELGWTCIPLVAESYGAWGSEAVQAFSRLASYLATRTNSPKSKLRILFFYSKGLNPPAILKRLQEEGMLATRQGIWKFIKKFNSDGKIGRRLGSGRKTNIISEIKAIVNEQMKKDDETTASQLHALLISRGYYLSYRAILRCRSALGWTFRGSAYCQMIGEQNKLKRLNWAIAHLHEAETGFKDVVWTDECTVQLESHRRICCLKGGEAPKNKQRATKVHVWAGISLEGATGICIFDGVMDGPLYIQILQQTLLPFLRDVLPHGHRFMADNDPKNASRLNQQFVADSRINCWRTPAESPDCNPIKNLWHELKEFIRKKQSPLLRMNLLQA
eukprot:Em0006g1137a